MGFLDGILAPLASAAGAGYLGYAEDKQNAVKAALAEKQAKRQESQDALAAALSGGQLAHVNAQTDLIKKPPETFGDFETVMQNGQPTVVQRSNRGTVKVVGPAVPKGPPQTVQAGEGILQPDGSYKVPIAKPADKPQIIQGIGDDGKPRFFRVDPRSGAAVPIDGIEGKPIGGAANNERGGQAAAFLSRLKMGKADFDNGMKFVRDFHDKLAGGQAEITPAMMAQMASAETNPNTEAHGVAGSLGNAATALMQGYANQSITKEHPDYQRYRNLINSMSLALTEVLPRPTQQLLGIEKGINIAKAGDSPARLKDIQHRLDTAYDYLFKNPEGMLTRTGAAPAGTPEPSIPSGKPLTAAQYQAARAHYTDDEIRAQGYRIPQGGE